MIQCAYGRELVTVLLCSHSVCLSVLHMMSTWCVEFTVDIACVGCCWHCSGIRNCVIVVIPVVVVSNRSVCSLALSAFFVPLRHCVV